MACKLCINEFDGGDSEGERSFLEGWSLFPSSRQQYLSARPVNKRGMNLVRHGLASVCRGSSGTLPSA